mgnify:CR=1 FL=1
MTMTTRLWSLLLLLPARAWVDARVSYNMAKRRRNDWIMDQPSRRPNGAHDRDDDGDDGDELYRAVRPRLHAMTSASFVATHPSLDDSTTTTTTSTTSHSNLSYYVELPSVVSLSDQDVECIRFENGIEVEAPDAHTTIAKPVRSFAEASLPTWVSTQLLTLGFQVRTINEPC